MADNTSNAKMIQIILSIFSSAFTLTLLYDYSHQKGIWIAYLLLAYGIVHSIQAFINKYCYTPQQAKDVDKVLIDQICIVLYLTIMFVLTKVILDIVTFFVALNPMQWYDYINIALPALVFMMAIVSQIDF